MPVSLNFSTFRPGAKDTIDACVAALTVAEFENGRGCEVGSDGLGAIVLPLHIGETVPMEVLSYPKPR